MAAELRRLRRDAGKSLEDAAEHVGWRSSMLSRVENRQRGIKLPELRSLLDFYGVTDTAQRKTLTDLARLASQRGWWESYPSGSVPSDYATLIGLEEEASTIKTFEHEIVPGLLQTKEYARAVITARRPALSEREVSRRVDVRMERQEILTREDPPPPKLHVVLSEGAVRRRVAGPETMQAQLLHLTEVREEANVTVQILPFTAGAHASMVGSFTMLAFPDPEDLGFVNIETRTSALVIEKPEELKVYEETWSALVGQAISVDDSRAMLRTYRLL